MRHDVETFLRQNYDWLLGISKRFCRGGDAEDLCHQVAESIIRAADSFSGDEGDFRAWAYVITRNAHIKNRRGEKCRGFVVSTWRTDIETDDVESGDSPPETIHMEEEAVDHIMSCVKDLRPAYRGAMLLHISGVTDQEIAQKLGVAPGTVKSRIHRARAALSETIDPTNRCG